jgi:hypothetical protein
MRKLFKNLRSKEAGKPEVQNGKHALDSPKVTAPHVTSNTLARDTDTLPALELFSLQNLSIAASVDEETSISLSGCIAQAGHDPAGADARAKESPPATEFAAQQTQAISTSQRLWNDAYENLQKNDSTAKLVKSYAKILITVLQAERASDFSASEVDALSVELEDPFKRQKYMRDLVNEGQKNIATTSKIAEGIGTAFEYINKAKDMISVAIGNIPQAALPWAGVCLGLQVRYHPLHLVHLVLALLIFD